MRVMDRFVLAALLFGSQSPAWCGDATSQPPSSPSAATPAQEAEQLPRERLSFGAGVFHPGSEHAEVGRSDGITLVGVLGFQTNRYLAVDMELSLTTQNYDRPEGIPGCTLCVLSDRIDVSTAGFSVIGKAGYPVAFMRPYLGVGLGVFHSEAVLRGTLLGFPGDYIRHTDTSIAPTAVAGIEHRVSRRSAVVLEYRYTDLYANFGELSDDRISLAGSSIFLACRWVPGAK